MAWGGLCKISVGGAFHFAVVVVTLSSLSSSPPSASALGLQTIAVGSLAQSKQTSLDICDAEAEGRVRCAHMLCVRDRDSSRGMRVLATTVWDSWETHTPLSALQVPDDLCRPNRRPQSSRLCGSEVCHLPATASRGAHMLCVRCRDHRSARRGTLEVDITVWESWKTPAPVCA